VASPLDPVRSVAEATVAAPREKLWRLLANTERLNRSIGLPAVSFGPPAGGSKAFVRPASARMYGISIEWDEFPFEWTEPNGYRVRRVFRGGPLAEFVGGADFAPAGPGCTRVTIVADIRPRAGWARFLARAAGAKGCADTLRYVRKAVWPWERFPQVAYPPPARTAPANRLALDRGAAALRSAGAPAEAVDRLIAHLAEAGDEEVAHMRPFALADTWGLPRLDVLRTFLLATRSGLLELTWDLICPHCRVAKASFASLGAMHPVFSCDVCRTEYEAEFDRSVELRFTVHPDVRAVREATYCVGGPYTAAHVRIQAILKPGKIRTLAAELPSKSFRVRVVGSNAAASLRPSGGTPAALSLTPGGFEPAETTFAPGRTSLAVENRTASPHVVVVEDPDWTDTAVPAALVTSLQDFRDLFSSEVLDPRRSVAIRSLAVLFTDLQGSTAMYREIGDAPAFRLVRDHLDLLTESVRRHQGAVVKTIGDAIMAVFTSPADALAAGLDMQRALAAFNAKDPARRNLVLRIGIHAGPAIAINANDVLDYFGTTVNLAARVQGTSRGNDLVLSKETADLPAVAGLIAAAGLTAEPFTSDLKGIARGYPLVRLTAAES
jgi:adenylate cyclase